MAFISLLFASFVLIVVVAALIAAIVAAITLLIVGIVLASGKSPSPQQSTRPWGVVLIVCSILVLLLIVLDIAFFIFL